MGLASRQFGLAFAFTLLASASASAFDLTYQITKDGEPIGTETVTVAQKDDVRQVRVKTQTHVKVLFFNFDYEHERNENWIGDKLQSMSSKTSDDGEHHAYSLLARDGGYLIQQDGKDDVSVSGFPLSLWNKSFANYTTLLSVIDAQPYQVKITQISEDHYRIDGDVVRDLWFAKDGYLQKAAFERKGYNIEFLRD